ncbi:MAG: TonB-dependent receptor [Bacteroidota bacterium]
MKDYFLTKEITTSTPISLIRELLKGLPFELQSTSNVFLIVPKKPPLISGKVIDKKSGTPLAYALVQSKNNSAVADQNGFFSLPPIEDTLKLKVSYLGYKKADFTVLPDAKPLEINMEQNPLVLQEVILDANKENDLSIPVSSFTLNPRQFNALPVLGETDVFKTLQLLPGISATNESTLGFQVRGSNAYQNLVIMDGFTVYHLDHFFGIFSTINPNFINTVNIYKGGFSAEYGGRASSVVDVSSRPGFRDKVSGGAGINFLSTNFYLDIPISNKLNAMIGLRNSFTSIIESDLYTDFLTSSRQNFISSFDNPNLNSLELSPSLSFYDLNAKMSYRPSDKTTININLYLNEDNYQGTFSERDEISEYTVIDKANWSNVGFSLRWDQLLKKDYLLTLSLSASKFRNTESLFTGLNAVDNIEFNQDRISANSVIEQSFVNITNQVNDISFKLQNEFFLTDQSELLAGMEINNLETDYSSLINFQDFLSDSVEQDFADSLTQNTIVTSFFTSYTNRIGRLAATFGMRTNYYEIADKWFTEPRINLGFQVTDRLQMKGSFSYHYQFLNQTSLSLMNPDRFYWVLSDDDIVPVMKGKHLIFGAHYSYQNWRFEAELYQRRTTGISANRYINLPPGILEDLEIDEDLSGENLSRGMELFAKYKSQIFTSWISYSLASSQDEFLFLNNGEPYDSDTDQRHEINVVNMLKLGKWELASTMIYGSGKPYTPPVDNAEVRSTIFYEDSDRINTKRFDSYRRIDLSAKYSFSLKKLNFEAGLTLFNVFDFRNIKSRSYVRQFIFDEQSSQIANDEIRIIPLDTYLLGFTPNFFFNVRF